MMTYYALILELLLVATHGACEEECDVSLLQRGLSLNDDQLDSASMSFADELANLERDVASLQQEEQQAVQAKSKHGLAKDKLNELETLEKQRQSVEAEEQRQVQEKDQTAFVEELLRKEQEEEEQRQTQQKEIEKLKAEEALLMEAIPQLSEQKPSLAFLEGLAAVLPVAPNSSKQSAGVSMMAATANSTNSTESESESVAEWMSSHKVVSGVCAAGIILLAIGGRALRGHEHLCLLCAECQAISRQTLQSWTRNASS